MTYGHLERRRHHDRMLRAAAGADGTGKSGRTGFFDSDSFARADWILLGACITIIIFGLVMVYSASRNKVDDQYYFVVRQAVAVTIGAGVFTWLLRVDYRKFRDYSMLAYVLT